MARVTVEDCLKHVDNRFQLVSVAADRARKLIRGSVEPQVQGKDKATVLALREIAQGCKFVESEENLAGASISTSQSD
jgi:DNA-directed RNA polymerase subunit omega